MIRRRTSLSANIISFCQYLRTKDFYVGLQTEKECLQILSLDPEMITSPQRFKQTLQLSICKSKRDLDLFSHLYDRYWKELEKAVDSKTKDEDSPTQQSKQKQAPSISQLKSWLYNEQTTDEFKTASYSALSTDTNQQTLNIDESEMKEMLRYVNEFLSRLANKRTRRFVDSRRKELINLRRSIRKNMLSSDELLHLMHKEKKKKLRIVLLCDVSKSVELYSMFFLKFMFTLKSSNKHTEIFSFSTDLQRLTEDLKMRNISKSIQALSLKLTNWAGGTKIGECLDDFITSYSHRFINKHTVVFIVSDGWDTGDISLIEDSMKLIQQRSMKVVWLNPLMASPDWKPEVAGMKAALPYIDLLLPFHNLDSVKSLSSALSSV